MKEIEELGSIFDPTFANRLSRMTFLRSLCDRIAGPVMPDDQDFEYLPTQAVADFLATEGKAPLDGILFPSVQAGNSGLNAVLFHKASRCDELGLPTGTRISVSTSEEDEDGWERAYAVSETVPKQQAESPPKSFDPPASFVAWEDFEEGDYRETALRIDPMSVKVHIVNAVKFDTERHDVIRDRREEIDLEKLPF